MADTAPTEGGASQLLLRRSGAGYAPLLRVIDSMVIPPQPRNPQRRLLLVLSDGLQFVIGVLSAVGTTRMFRDHPHGVPSGCIMRVILWETERREEQVVVNLRAFYIIPGSP
eukprot:8689205-Heterocapsa_arctica.AAC.1